MSGNSVASRKGLVAGKTSATQKILTVGWDGLEMRMNLTPILAELICRQFSRKRAGHGLDCQKVCCSLNRTRTQNSKF